MAGYDTTRLGRATRRFTQAVGVRVLIGLIMAVAWSDASHAAFTITTKNGAYTSACYQIQGRMIRLCTGEAMALHDVTAIDSAALTPEERSARRDAFVECYGRLETLAAADARLAEKETKAQELLEYIVGLHAGDKPGKRYKDALRDAASLLDGLIAEARTNKQAWEQIILPDYALVPLRDIKNLQYTARMLSYQEWRRYLGNGDLTLREYAREHQRQVCALEIRFHERLEKIRAFEVDSQRMEFPAELPSEPGTPAPIIIPEWPR